MWVSREAACSWVQEEIMPKIKDCYQEVGRAAFCLVKAEQCSDLSSWGRGHQCEKFSFISQHFFIMEYRINGWLHVVRQCLRALRSLR